MVPVGVLLNCLNEDGLDAKRVTTRMRDCLARFSYPIMTNSSGRATFDKDAANLGFILQRLQAGEYTAEARGTKISVLADVPEFRNATGGHLVAETIAGKPDCEIESAQWRVSFDEIAAAIHGDHRQSTVADNAGKRLTAPLARSVHRMVPDDPSSVGKPNDTKAGRTLACSDYARAFMEYSSSKNMLPHS